MPLRYIRKVTADDALGAVIATTAVTRELADCLQFPPAKAAASILLMIFQTIQSIQTNRSDCYRLARRCLSLLVDIREQMEGRWEKAPESLVRNITKFERVLTSIHEFMKNEVDHKWSSRLLRKSSIEDALADHNAALDDASRSFQIATLIHIHYAVGDREHSPSTASEGALLEPATSVPAESSTSKSLALSVTTNAASMLREDSNATLISSPDSFEDKFANLNSPIMPRTSSPVDENDESTILVKSSSEDFLVVEKKTSISEMISRALPAAVPEEELEPPLEDRGFRRYHQSELKLRGNRKSSIKKGWWAGATEVEVDGKQAIVKRYEGSAKDATKKWMRDVRMLQNLYHPNLPQMLGYSNDESPTPFILLANVQTRLPQAMVLDYIKKSDLASCIELIARFYRDTLDAALYLQRQLNLSESKTQDYVEHASFRIDAGQTLVMGLPPPEVDKIESWRNFGLAHSVRDVYIKLLPNRGWTQQPYDVKDTTASIEYQTKLSHLAVLVKALLPSSADASTASNHLKKVLKDESEEEDEELEIVDQPLNLRTLRKAAIELDTLQHSWRNNDVAAYQYSVGDLGYMSDEVGERTFVVLCNVLEEAGMQVESSVWASQNSWDSGSVRQEGDLEPFHFPGGVKGWTVMVPPGTKQNVQVVHDAEVKSIPKAWSYLMNHGQNLAKKYNVKPEDLMLVTKAGVDFRFYAQHHGPTASHGHIHNQPFGQQQHVGQQQHFGHQPHFPNRGGFGGGGFNRPAFGQQAITPTVLYLFTALDKDHEAYWSQTPFYVPLAKGAQPPEIRAQCWTGLDRAYGFLNYVQLHAEDFED